MPEIHIVLIGQGVAGAAFVNATATKLPAARITVLDPSTDFMWPPSAVRAFLDQSFEEKMARPNVDMAKKYQNVNVIKTRATACDINAKTVSTSTGQIISYDFLVIACGSSLASPWKKSEDEIDPSQALRQQLSEYRKVVKNAKTVVIAGAGPVGIESAGEIKSKYPHIRVILINAHTNLLDVGDWPAGVARSLSGQLSSIGVEVHNNVKTMSPTTSSITPVSVELSDRTSLHADVFLSCAGVRPNSSFLPASMLDQRGWIKTTPELLSEGHKDIFVIGDATNFNRKVGWVAESQGNTAAANLVALTKNQDASKLKKYTDDAMWLGLVHIGTKGGSGSVGWIRFPWFMVSLIKGGSLFVSKVASFF